MPVTLTQEQFLADRRGTTFRDVVNDSRIDFRQWLDFFNDPARQVRMEDSEIHHDRPALAGVIRELECHPDFRPYLEKAATSLSDARTAQRGHQVIGVIVCLVMEARGWCTTGRKGCLGRRDPGKPGGPNVSGLSKWFTKSERYELPGGMPFRSP